jgi:hypothetical protein
MEKHPTSVEGFDGTLEELASKVARMRYDHFALFIKSLEDEVHKEAKKDDEAGRKKLGGALYQAMRALRQAKHALEEAWRISKPHMRGA